MKVQVNTDYADTVRALLRFALETDAERHQVLTYGGQTFVELAQKKAPVGKKVHYRYTKKNTRVRKNGATYAAKYYPGNLKKGLGILDLKRTQAVIIGPVAARTHRGEFGRLGRYDAYYAHFQEFGTENNAAQPFMRPAFELGKNRAIYNIKRAISQIVQKHNRNRP